MSRNLIREAIANPAKHPRIFIFVITYGFGIATTGLSTLILDNLGNWVQSQWGINKLWWQVIVVVGISALVALGLSSIPQVLRALLRRALPLDEDVVANVIPITQTDHPTYAGLIAVMSPSANSPAEVSIHHHWANGSGRLKHCWLIGTDRTQTAIDEMVMRLQSQGMPIQVVHSPHFCLLAHNPRQVYLHYGQGYLLPNLTHQQWPFCLHLNDEIADDPNHIRELVDHIYRDADTYDLTETEIIADYTGGTKSMTAGIILACATPDRRIQYLSQITGEVMEVRISYKLKSIKG